MHVIDRSTNKSTEDLHRMFKLNLDNASLLDKYRLHRLVSVFAYFLYLVVFTGMVRIKKVVSHIYNKTVFLAAARRTV